MASSIGKKYVSDTSADETMRRASLLIGVLPIIFGVFLAWAQNASDPQACQGSTVDSQGTEFAQKSRAFLAELQTAVRDGDKTKVASMISYPVMVIHGSHKTRFKTKTQFIAEFDTILDARVQKAITQQSAKCLFGNYQGAMIGTGEVWFSQQQDGSMKIITVNPTAGSQ
jgi:hypothetical protein